MTAKTVILPKGYKPSTDEQYMNPIQIEYFRQKLATWRDDLVEESRETISNLQSEVRDVGDEAERATRETENSLELRTRDRYRKLINKINKTLSRIDDGEYGYCRETENSLELRTRDRYRKLINKINKTLSRIDDGEYGYCEETGEEIGLQRLEARPIATLCLDAQERWEIRQKQMGDSA